MAKKVFGFLLWLICGAMLVYGEDDFGSFDALDELPVLEKSKSSSYKFHGSVGSSYGAIKNQNGDASLEIHAKADINLQYSLGSTSKLVFSASNNGEIDKDWAEQYKISQFYWQEQLSAFDITLGRQIISWGKSDAIKLNDIINPLDYSNGIATTDIKDLKLAVGTLKLDAYLNAWQVSLLGIFEPRFIKLPPNDSLPHFTKPPTKMQYALSGDGRFRAFDVSLYLANIYQDGYFLDMSSTPARSLGANQILLLGSGLSAPLGAFLFKLELAYKSQVKYTNTISKNNLSTLLGFDYSLNNGSLSIEMSNKNIQDYETAMNLLPFGLAKDTISLALRANKQFFHNALNINYLTLLQHKNEKTTGFWKLSSSYQFGDDLSIEGGVVDSIFDVKESALGMNVGSQAYLSLGLKY